ncbi:MAG: AtpZ/AtpI family protein [Brumimicrobium sp.]|nr:AtpZ/AtpI family protein [Brumimicrobium sp.]
MASEKDDRNNQVKNYLKFSTLGLQMGILITAAALSGQWLDAKQANKHPVWTIVLVLIAIFGSLYSIIREVNKLGKDKDD